MKLLSFKSNGRPSWGVRVEGGVVDCGQALGLPTLQAAIEADALGKAEKFAGGNAPRLALDAIDYLPLLPDPGKIICVGLNYVDHAAETDYKAPTYPVLFIRHANSLVAHDAPLIRPIVSEQFDYEGELVIVIGKQARHVKKQDALSYVCGYSLFNDASVRDYQFKSHQWYMGKNFDGTGAFGPCLVTADELPPGAAGLRIQTRLNGQVVQDANTSDMIFDVATLIATITEGITLNPGDVIVAGTPSGIGLARTPPLWMKDGDRCEVEIERIGILSNPVKDE